MNANILDLSACLKQRLYDEDGNGNVDDSRRVDLKAIRACAICGSVCRYDVTRLRYVVLVTKDKSDVRNFRWKSTDTDVT